MVGGGAESDVPLLKTNAGTPLKIEVIAHTCGVAVAFMMYSEGTLKKLVLKGTTCMSESISSLARSSSESKHFFAHKNSLVICEIHQMIRVLI